jgi:hypothetical protein
LVCYKQRIICSIDEGKKEGREEERKNKEKGTTVGQINILGKLNFKLIQNLQATTVTKFKEDVTWCSPVQTIITKSNLFLMKLVVIVVTANI